MDSAHRRGGMVSISPSQTPRSTEKSARDLRSGGFDSGNGVNVMNKMHEKEKGVNVQVIVRCRPLSDDEIKVNTPAVITCNDGRKEVTAMQIIASKQIDKTFTFDKVFGPTSQQKDLYDSAVSPIVFEVLEGYNCTIFAYGQTGTGKTYTMEGGSRKKNGDFPKDAGVIPRAVRQIFDILEAQNAEYSMKVTFLELYNEEISDLLANEESSKFADDKGKKPIALMEDGKGGVFVRGLEEEIVTTANEIYKILEKGSAKRRTAETLLNKQSSRSHSIFSITIHIKECTPEGEEMIRCGKLNLVDLAGSENISRSGARENRAREAGEINKSLLTLGRVINALVDHAGHVPYRDSKLTRLLRDSLGGKTKTCIIATISPSIHSLEESLNTLDYAYRAKNIKNKPEINQKMLKSDIMKDLYSEIVRLKQEVYAAREKNGIYIPRERYMQEESEKKTMAEKIEKMELESEIKDKNLAELQDLYSSQLDLTANLTTKLEITENKLGETEQSLSDLEEKHRQANATIKDKDFLISNLLKSEKALMERAFELRSELESASSDVSGLFSKIERKSKIEEENQRLVRNFESQLTLQLELLHKTVETSTKKHEKHLKDMEEDMRNFVSEKTQATDELRIKVGNFKSLFGRGIGSLSTIAKDLEGNPRTTLGNLNNEIVGHSTALGKVFQEIASKADSLLNDLQTNLQTQQKRIVDYAQQQREAHSKVVETERSVSNALVEFFETLETHAAKVNNIVTEAQIVNDDKLSVLEKKLQECAVNEEKQMLEKVAELFASFNSTKKKLVEEAVDDLRRTASTKSKSIQHEMALMQNSSTSMKSDWGTHIEKAESNYLQHTCDVAEAKNNLEDIVNICLQKARNGSQQWKDAEASLLHLVEENVASANAMISEGIEEHAAVGERFWSAVCCAIGEADSANERVIGGVDEALRIDHVASEKIRAKMGPFGEGLNEMKGMHLNEIDRIREIAGKCLVEDYAADEESGSTPRKRPVNLPNVASIEELRTPSFDDLLKSSKQSFSPLDASRPPLAAIN